MGCEPENDTWGIEWQFVNAGTLAIQICSGLSESSGMQLKLWCLHSTQIVLYQTVL